MLFDMYRETSMKTRQDSTVAQKESADSIFNRQLLPKLQFCQISCKF